MVCPVCGEPLDLEGYEAGDLLDREACGAVLRPLSDGTLEEVRALEADLLEALRRLEKGVGEEAPKEVEDEPNLEPDYLTVHVETDGGPMALRRVVFPGAPDLLEFTLPSGSLYEFPFRQVVKTLRPILL
jgi:hypothetical protein